MDLAQLQAEVQSLGYGSDTLAYQTQFINAAYREIHSMMRWPFLEAIDDGNLVTVVGQSSYNFPNTMSNWRNIDAVRIAQTANQNFPQIKWIPPQDLFDKLQDSSSITSTPTHWSMYAQQLWFYPQPDDTYSVTIYYCIEPPDLVNSTDVPLIPIAFHDAITFGAICRMALRERDWIGLELSTTKYQALVTALQEEYLVTQRQSGIEVEKSGYWDTAVNYPLMPTSGI